MANSLPGQSVLQGLNSCGAEAVRVDTTVARRVLARNEPLNYFGDDNMISHSVRFHVHHFHLFLSRSGQYTWRLSEVEPPGR